MHDLNKAIASKLGWEVVPDPVHVNYAHTDQAIIDKFYLRNPEGEIVPGGRTTKKALWETAIYRCMECGVAEEYYREGYFILDWAESLEHAFTLVPKEGEEIRFSLDHNLGFTIWTAHFYDTLNKKTLGWGESAEPAEAICKAWLAWQED